jgi:hypothetical protein
MRDAGQKTVDAIDRGSLLRLLLTRAGYLFIAIGPCVERYRLA